MVLPDVVVWQVVVLKLDVAVLAATLNSPAGVLLVLVASNVSHIHFPVSLLHIFIWVDHGLQRDVLPAAGLSWNNFENSVLATTVEDVHLVSVADPGVLSIEGSVLELVAVVHPHKWSSVCWRVIAPVVG